LKKITRILTVIILLLTSSIYGAEILSIRFPPCEDCHMPIIRLYDGAEKYIHLAIYSLTKDEIAEALIRAHKRGVEVKVLIDKAQAGIKDADDEKLEAEGIEVRRDKKPGLMHNKFAVIDGIIIYTGSYNHTEGATTKNDENYIIIKDIGIAHIYETQFQKLWEKHK
jgi:phosphatidylserine/phosphatidylglycerophosphate/cardiolipin synthase-like enzyme